MNFIENESPEKLRGGYYTDAAVADYLARWIAEIRPVRVLEPSCGDGAFIGALGRAGIDSLEHVVCCEIVPAEASAARRRAANELPGVRVNVCSTDFLEWALTRKESEPRFDAVVGNPPFIRYQYLDERLQARAEAIFRRFGLPFTRHTNAWVPFVIASISMLRPGGRLAMVVPAELLHVLHAQGLRTYLQRACSRVLVIDPEELWFAEALQGVVLLLAERAPRDADGGGQIAINAVRGKEFFHRPAASEFARASFVAAAETDGKWMPALLTQAERSLLARLRERPSVCRLKEVARVSVGIVTGANKFFLVPDETVERYSLDRFAHPMFGRSEHVPGVVYDQSTHAANREVGYPTNFLWFDAVSKTELPSGARSYIDAGEAAKLHQRFKCRIRKPWYSVPSVFATPMGMLKRSHDHPRMILNRLGAYTTDTAYRVVATNCMVPEQLVFAYVNSMTALSAELEGRHYGGGVLELVPSEIGKLLFPYCPQVEPDVASLDATIRRQARPEELLAEQDARVLRPLGFTRAECDTLRNAWFRLKGRRQRVTTLAATDDED